MREKILPTKEGKMRNAMAICYGCGDDSRKNYNACKYAILNNENDNLQLFTTPYAGSELYNKNMKNDAYNKKLLTLVKKW